MTRTEVYRKQAFQFKNYNVSFQSECHYARYLRALGVMNAGAEPNIDLRRAIIECTVLDHVPVAVNDHELLVGRFSDEFTLPDDAQGFIDAAFREHRFVGSSNTYHRVVDYDTVINEGIDGILSRLDAHLAAAEDEEKRCFYRGCRMVLEAVCRLAGRYEAALLEKARETPDETRKRELLAMAENFRKAPRHPCTGFYEALQCMWFIQYCVKLLWGMTLTGRPDNYLYPLYRKDLAEGRITKDFAFELIEQLYFKNNELHGVDPASLMVGGVDKNNVPVLNDLTWMCIDAIQTVGLVNPSVAVAYVDGMPDAFLDRCIDCIAAGYTYPSIFNDGVIQKGLLRAGVSPEDARYYIHSNCVEITPIGASHIMVATPYINLLKAFEYLLCRDRVQVSHEQLPVIGPGYGGDTEEIHISGDVDFCLADIRSFDEFLSLLKDITAKIIRVHLASACAFQEQIAASCAATLVSSLTRDCIQNGRDCGRGGARYNFDYPCLIGFANFIDSIAAVKKAVFEEKRLTLAELAVQCAQNFPDGRIHAYLKNIPPKFGNGDPESDAIAVELYDFIAAECGKYETLLGGRFYPGYFAYIFHGLMGKQTMATPDGRRAYSALSEHIGAVRGMDKNGPLGVIESIARLDHAAAIGGIATNYRFTRTFAASPAGKEAIRHLIRHSMEAGCFEMQFNVVSQEELKAAQERPEEYQTLLVRVAGFSAYFVDLDRSIQDEIIERTEHGGLGW